MFWIVTALAAPAPELIVEDDGTFVGTFVTTRAPAEVKALVGDPAWVVKTDDTGSSVTEHPSEGPCKVMTTVSPSPFKTVTYKIKYCPTDTGWSGTLIESNAMTLYSLEWRVLPKGSGSEVTYQLDLKSNLMVPRFLINRATRNHLEHMFGQVQGALDAGA